MNYDTLDDEIIHKIENLRCKINDLIINYPENDDFKDIQKELESLYMLIMDGDIELDAVDSYLHSMANEFNDSMHFVPKQ